MSKIFINPGHAPNGQPDPGAVNPITGLRESDVVAKVGGLVSKYLQSAKCETQVLQNNSLAKVVEAANQWCADLFVSIHCNSVKDSKADGTETWYCQGSSEGNALADYIQKQIIAALPLTDRGLKEAVPGISGLYVLSNTDMAACLVELAFISNAEDEHLLVTKQDDFARAVARGITDFLVKMPS
ncbi:MAG: N-acetylmuramoyl-L-alanine amidase [Sporomusa sp.]|nr:N-acetylmuramoyl-L-alanine amidase [Sporomusa sp.]